MKYLEFFTQDIMNAYSSSYIPFSNDTHGFSFFVDYKQ